MSIRDIKRKARRDLHDRAKIPAVYVAASGDAGTLIHIRAHTKFEALELDNSENGLAARRELQPKIIFMRDELEAKGIILKRKAKVSVEPGEAYVLDSDDAPDDITVTWFVTIMKPGETVGLPVPGDADE